MIQFLMMSDKGCDLCESSWSIVMAEVSEMAKTDHAHDVVVRCGLGKALNAREELWILLVDDVGRVDDQHGWALVLGLVGLTNFPQFLLQHIPQATPHSDIASAAGDTAPYELKDADRLTISG